MANIDPVRLLQANPAENLSNLNPADQADSLTDQSLMSFPDELSAAKQQQRDEDPGFDQRGQDSPDSPFNLQILPVNQPAGGAQPANIADAIKNVQDSGLVGIAPGSPSLAQLEIAQSIIADVAAPLLADNAALGLNPVIEANDVALDAPIAITAASAAIGIAQAPIVLNGEALSKVGTDALPPTVDGILAAPATESLVALAPDRASITQAPELLVTASTTLSSESSQAPLEAEIGINPNANSLLTKDSLTSIHDSSAVVQLMPSSAESSNTAIRIDPLLNSTDAVGAQLIRPIATELSSDPVIDPLNLPSVQLNVGSNELGDPDSLVQPAATASQAQVLSPANSAAVNMEGVGALLPQSTAALSNEAGATAAATATATALAGPAVALSGSASPAKNAPVATAVMNARDLKAPATEVLAVELEPSTELVSTVLAADASEVGQSISSSQGLAASMRAVSNETADTKIQELRLDNAKASVIDAPEMAVTNAPLKEVALPDSVESAITTSSSNPASSFVDPMYRSATSPFASEQPSWTQSAQPVRLEPQQASLSAGPLHVEVMRVLREGGGRVILEVTPPDQGAIQLDLRLDGNGRAYLIVEGASDSTKARLEQGGAQLKEQLAELGLSLNLDMRDRSSQSDHIPFGFNPNFARNTNGAGVDAESQLGDIPAARSGITPDGRVSIYA